MKVKLIDVANKAGVSKSTVSQYLNGRYRYMSDETRDRIKKVIEELNYIPNPIARSLKTEKTNTIGFMVSNVDGPVTSKVILGVDDYCKKHNYNLLIYNTDYDPNVEIKSINTLKALRADGLIISSSGQINDLLNQSDEGNLPIVHLHRDFEDLQVHTAYSNFYQAAVDATTYLTQLNHKRIGLMTRTFEGITTRENRIKGYKDVLTKAGIDVDQDLIKTVETQDEIIQAFEQMMALKEPPTAIFTLYSKITVELLMYCNEKDIIIPDDLSIIAFDDLPMANLLKTPLTVVTQSPRELGQQACELLLEKIDKPDITHSSVELPCYMIVRESCKSL